MGLVCPTMLFVSGSALHLIWSGAERTPADVTGTVLTAAALVVNQAWGLIFFGAHRIGLALLDSVVANVLAVAAAWYLWQVNELSGKLMAVYSAWYIFCTLLNLSYLRRNSKKEAQSPSRKRKAN